MNEQRDLEGLSALVTGASSGIGKAVVDAVTANGGKARFV